MRDMSSERITGTTGTAMQNTLHTGDNLPVLWHLEAASVDLVYLDPPFNSGRTHSAPDGSRAEGARFRDTWPSRNLGVELPEALVSRHPAASGLVGMVGAVHGESMAAYTAYMALRIAELHRVLRDTGSIYLHCDPRAAHCLRMVLDAVFGPDNFINEIVWHYQTGGAGKRAFPKKHDVILLYGRTGKYTFNPGAATVPRTEKSLKRARNPAGARISGDDTEKTAMDVWTDIPALNPMSRERTGYPTQKPLALLRRIIEVSSNPGELVLDPFCGSGTACVAAHQLDRRWLGIDIEESVPALLEERLGGEGEGKAEGLFRHSREPE